MEWWVLALISAAFSAAASIYEKKTLFIEGALDFSTSLALITCVLSIPFIWFVNFNLLTALPLFVLLCKSVLAALAFLLIMKGLKDLEISSALPLMVLTPGIVALASFFIFNEKLTGYEIAGMIMLLAGTYLLQVVGMRKDLNLLKGYLNIFGALIIYSTTAILDKVLVSRLSMSPVEFMFFEHIYLAGIFLVLFFSAGRTGQELSSVLKRSGRLILIVAACTIIYRFSQIWAVKLGSVALVLSLKRTAVFFAIVIGGRIFKDSNLLIRSIATAVMIAGAFLIVLL